MHISCPRCDTVINVRDENLFNTYTCKKCMWCFRGVHANQPHIRNWINTWIAPFYNNAELVDLANCVHCGSLIDLNWIGLDTKLPRTSGPLRHIGYNGPYVCWRCGRDLPWDYPPQYDFVIDEWNEEIKRKKTSSSSTKSEKETPATPKPDIASMAETLYKKKHGIKE